MNYEIINQESKIVAGISTQTNNQDPEMISVIGGLWNKFFGEGIYAAIPYKKNDKVMGIYTDYQSDEKGDYSIIVGCEVKQAEDLPQNVIVREFAGNKFAKFIVRGKLHEIVGEFWRELWKMDLDRTFIYDYEEYQDGNDQDTEIHFYIGIK